jgi:aminoglycoside phosphotransferase (APT) family kinase protein
MGPGTSPGGTGGTRLTSLTPEVIDWLASVLGSFPADGAITRLPGNTSTVLVLGGGEVLRWYDDGRFLEEEPEAIAREAAALTALDGSGVPAPRLIAASERAPAALLMTRLAGSPDLDIPDPVAIVDLLATIHAVSPGGLARWSYRGYHEDRDLARPGWWRDAGLWDRAVRQTTSARPGGQGVFIHRDFHPGNLLWTGRSLTGIVDWVNACVGPAAVDTAHLRVNLAVLGDVANAEGVVAGHPAWDIEAAFDFLDWGSRDAVETWPGPWPELDAATARIRLEAFMAQAVAQLG